MSADLLEDEISLTLWWKKPVVFDASTTELKKKGNKLLLTGCIHVNSFNYVYFFQKKKKKHNKTPSTAAWSRLC